MPFADANGQRLYYESHGEGEPLVIVMGLAADHLAWAMQVPEWSKHYRVIEFDNRDVGQSSYAEGPYEIADMARDTLALADELGLDSFHLLGMSMGGTIAQEDHYLDNEDWWRPLKSGEFWEFYRRNYRPLVAG